MFADVDADVFVLVDGDATYEAQAAPRMVRRVIDESLDFVNGARVSKSMDAYRRGHRFGNYVLTALVQDIFGRQFTDMLSGYKVFSRRYVKSFPAMSRGFEIETELTVHALELRMPSGEELTAYGERPPGSVSKLSTFRDGARILRLIFDLLRNERPLKFFGLAGVCPHPCRGGARDSDCGDLSRNGTGPPTADGRPRHRNVPRRFLELPRRADTRCRSDDAQRDEETGVSVISAGFRRPRFESRRARPLKGAARRGPQPAARSSPPSTQAMAKAYWRATSSSRSNRPEAPAWPASIAVRNRIGPPPVIVARSRATHLAGSQ